MPAPRQALPHIDMDSVWLLERDNGPVLPDEATVYGLTRQAVAEWHLLSHLEFAALPTAAASARKHGRAVALECGLPGQADTIELIVSELITNALRATENLHGSGLAFPVVRLWLASGPRGLLIGVWDASAQMPARQDASPDDERGRGLMLIETLADEWRAYPADGGKVVWVIVS
jgi:anti-sigma regulatory factor (Ser/Thr protein kinase)